MLVSTKNRSVWSKSGNGKDGQHDHGGKSTFLMTNRIRFTSFHGCEMDVSRLIFWRRAPSSGV